MSHRNVPQNTITIMIKEEKIYNIFLNQNACLSRYCLLCDMAFEKVIFDTTSLLIKHFKINAQVYNTCQKNNFKLRKNR